MFKNLVRRRWKINYLWPINHIYSSILTHSHPKTWHFFDLQLRPTNNLFKGHPHRSHITQSWINHSPQTSERNPLVYEKQDPIKQLICQQQVSFQGTESWARNRRVKLARCYSIGLSLHCAQTSVEELALEKFIKAWVVEIISENKVVISQILVLTQ